MNNNQRSGYTVNDAQVEELFTCLTNQDQGVRTGALRLLVRLQLTRRSWWRLADIMHQQLNLYQHSSPDNQAQYPFEELLDASTRIPISTLRIHLLEFIQEDQAETFRQQAGWALARARDHRALDFLLPIVKKAVPAQSQEAAFWIAHYDHLYPLEQYQQLAVKTPEPSVRFWLSIAMLRQGEFEPIISLIIKYLDGKLELPLLAGSPLHLAQQVRECGYFPISFLAFLNYLHNPAELREQAGVASAQLDKLTQLILRQKARWDQFLPLVEALIAEFQREAATDEPIQPEASMPSTPWEGSPRTLITKIYQEAVWNLDSLQEALPRLSSSQKTNLISAWLAMVAELTQKDSQTGSRSIMIGIGNAVMQLPAWFWQKFDPDLGELFDIFVRLYPDRTDLMDQLAWVVSRAGIQRLAAEYLPLLAQIDPKEKYILLNLLERAVFFTRQDAGPVYGAGASPAASDLIPEIRHFIDYASAMAGGEHGGQVLDASTVPRYVQGEVSDQTDPANPLKLERVFLAGKAHFLKIWIGELKEGAIRAPAPIDLGDLPDLPSWDFQVYFWEPNHAPEVQIGTLTVYKDQLSDQPIDTCTFTFTPRTDLADFQGRLAVVYQKNVLQMLFIKGRVVSDPASASDSDQIRFEWAEVKGLANLNQLQEFDLVFYNESDSVQGAGLMFFGGKVGLKHISGLDEGIKGLTTALKEAGRPDAGTDNALHLALAVLANHGRMLYDTILEQIGPENEGLLRLREANRLQLVSAVRDVLPLELVYIYPAPDLDAVLCPHAQQALETGVCFECDSLDEASMVRRVCPMGFLGLRCTIERHTIQTSDQANTILEGMDFQLRAGWTKGEKVINPLRCSLGAASTVVKGENLQIFTTAMQALFANRFEIAQDKTNWIDKIIQTAPSMLILLSHSLKEYGIPRLEIGNTKLGKAEIKRAFGGVKDYRPLVLLIGCETADPDVPYQSFATDFSQAGAAIIVLTLSLIHESRATKIAEILIEQIHQSAQTRQTFSEALLQARRNAMMAGYAEALTLVADGDADWILDEEV